MSLRTRSSLWRLRRLETWDEEWIDAYISESGTVRGGWAEVPGSRRQLGWTIFGIDIWRLGDVQRKIELRFYFGRFAFAIGKWGKIWPHGGFVPRTLPEKKELERYKEITSVSDVSATS